MDTFITVVLLVVVLALPITIVLTVKWFLRRRGMSTYHDPPDTIDYDRW